ISYFYIFGAIILIFTAIFFEPNADELGLVERFGIDYLPERLFRILLAVFTFIMIYGYMRLKRWGFWMMILYSIGFGFISYILTPSFNQQPFIGNVIWSGIMLIYSFSIRKSFQ
ncbi:hypothetical protein ACIQXQ_16430, partial [Peribacillus sp. NPDC097198]